MNKKYLAGFIGVYSCLAVLIAIWVHAHPLVLLSPDGMIALKERNLIFTAVSLMLFLAVPVIFLLFFIPSKYKSGNTKARYSPEWTGNMLLKILWWAIPGILCCILFVVVWKAAHELDPYKNIVSTTKPITIDVVALQWKWIFIYPEQQIATVNFVQFPVHTPVHFNLTADAPMTTFWIPTLGSQIYAMSTMQTQLNLIGNTIGDFPGETTEINGSGYAGMRFTARVSSETNFTAWVQHIKNSSRMLDLTEYDKVAKPSQNMPITFYSSVDKDLYNTIIMKDMNPSLSP